MSSFVTGKTLARRTFLRGVGAAVALPALDAMFPAVASARSLARTLSPTRLGFIYIPNGVIRENWEPAEVGKSFELPTSLEPLAPFKDDVLVMTGLAQMNGRALGDGAGDHARASATFLTGVHPHKTNGVDIEAGVSVDQVAAQAVGHKTRLPSLELSLEHGRLAGNCDSGYSCAYSNSISWRTETTPNPHEYRPRQVFNRLFGDYTEAESPEDRDKRRKYHRSVLDLVQDDTRRLKRKLGSTDRRKLDEYLDGVRMLERRIDSSENVERMEDVEELNVPKDIPSDYATYARLMFDLQVLAFQTDQTRIFTFMMGNEGSGRQYKEVGAEGGHHELSHHRGNESNIEQLANINRYHMEQFAYFVERLKSIREGDGTLLDHSMILYGSGLGDGNRHSHDDLPVILAGRGGGTLDPGRHLKYPEHTPLNNLALSLLAGLGVETDQLGDSTGKLDFLAM